VAIEKTYVATADFRLFEKMASKSPAILKLQNKILKEVLSFTVDQAWFHMLLTPEQRYEKFLKEYPTLEQRVLQKDLASYLGITPPSLSRLKSRID
jgi:CRP-like cAMP-binding protein